MTTQDILMLSFVISKEAAFCRGESDWWPPRDDEIRLVKTFFDEGSIIDYLMQGEKVRPVVMKLRKSLREFLDCASDELIDGNPKAMTIKGTVPFCEAWINWIDTYFPIDPNGQQQPGQETALAASAGRPSHKDKTVKDCMLLQDDEQKNELLKKLHELIDGKKGRRVALVVLVCEAMGLMTNPGHAVMMKEFGYIGARSGYNRFHDMGIKNYKKEEADGIMVHLAGFRDSLK